MGRDDEIRSIAYSLWEQGGHQEGHDYEYWLRAEEIWEQQNPNAKKTSTGSKPAAKQKTKVTSTSKR